MPAYGQMLKAFCCGQPFFKRSSNPADMSPSPTSTKDNMEQSSKSDTSTWSSGAGDNESIISAKSSKSNDSCISLPLEDMEITGLEKWNMDPDRSDIDSISVDESFNVFQADTIDQAGIHRKALAEYLSENVPEYKSVRAAEEEINIVPSPKMAEKFLKESLQEWLKSVNENFTSSEDSSTASALPKGVEQSLDPPQISVKEIEIENPKSSGSSLSSKSEQNSGSSCSTPSTNSLKLSDAPVNGDEYQKDNFPNEVPMPILSDQIIPENIYEPQFYTESLSDHILESSSVVSLSSTVYSTASSEKHENYPSQNIVESKEANSSFSPAY